MRELQLVEFVHLECQGKNEHLKKGDVFLPFGNQHFLGCIENIHLYIYIYIW